MSTREFVVTLTDSAPGIEAKDIETVLSRTGYDFGYVEAEERRAEPTLDTLDRIPGDLGIDVREDVTGYRAFVGKGHAIYHGEGEGATRQEAILAAFDDFETNGYRAGAGG